MSEGKTTKPWQLKDWREKRKVILEGKVCEWCSSSKDLVLHHREGILPYHDHESEIASEIFQRELSKGTIKAKVEACPKCESSNIPSRETMTPKYRCANCGFQFDKPILRQKRRLSKDEWRQFVDEHKEEIKRIVESERRQYHDDYVQLNGVMVLCKRCHMAIEKGLVLCKVCRERYHEPNFEMCRSCFSKTPEGKQKAYDREKLSYKHPWCGKEFLIERGLWEMFADPQGCCFHVCRLALSGECETAQRNWNKNEEYS